MTLPDLHLAEEALAAYADGRLSPSADERAARHLRLCAECREAVDVEREHRRRGLGDALLAGCRALAADAGCDLVTLVADAEGHPRRWYARRGFADTDRAWSASRT